MKLKNAIRFLLLTIFISLCLFWYAKYFSEKKIVFQQNDIPQEVNNSQDNDMPPAIESEEITETEIENNPALENQNQDQQLAEGSFGWRDYFVQDGMFEETGAMSESKMTDWWLNSGAFFSINNGIGKTVQGELIKGEKWQIDYRNYNTSETDGGFHPQNIFRLVTKTKWKDFHQECYYKINKYILSKDEHRNESNGLLLFNRYQNEDNLYYTGIRVDGSVVIKKKTGGKYFTMAYKPVYSGKYDRKKNPNLLPENTWIGIRSEVVNGANGMVKIKVYFDKDRSGNWKLVAEAKDDGKRYGGKSILNEGYAGIRTDFMDVEFDDYKIEELK